MDVLKSLLPPLLNAPRAVLLRPKIPTIPRLPMDLLMKVPMLLTYRRRPMKQWLEWSMTPCMTKQSRMANMTMNVANGTDSYSTDSSVVVVETTEENTRGNDRETVRCSALALPAQRSTTLLRLRSLKQ